MSQNSYVMSAGTAATRRQGVLQSLLSMDCVRNGKLSTAMQSLTKALCLELGVDRVSVTVRDSDEDELVFAQAFIAANDQHDVPFLASGAEPLTVFKFAEPGKPVIANDVAEHPALAPFQDVLFRPVGVRAMMQLPIDVNGALAGVINVSICHRPWVWSDDHVAFGTAIANLASLVIERHARRRGEQLRADAAQRLGRQQRALATLMHETSSNAVTLDHELRSITEMAAATLDIDRVSIWRFTPNAEAIVCLDMFDRRQQLHSSHAGFQRSEHEVYFDALRSDGVVVIDDVTLDARTASLLESYVPGSGVASLLNVAMFARQRKVGILCAEKCGSPIAWTEEQKLFVSAVTGLAALAIERHERMKVEAENVANTRRLSSHFKAVNALMEGESFQSSDFSISMRQMARTLCRQIGADHVRLHVASQEADDTLPYFSEVYDAARDVFAQSRKPQPTEKENAADLEIFTRHASFLDIRTASDIPAKLKVIIDRHDVRSLLQIPISLHGRVVGFVRAWTCGRTVHWASGEMLTIAVIAQLSALVLERHHRQAIEMQLRHANRAAEEASRAKSQFLANMSHEIRTPMNGVFGMTDLLLQTALTTRQSQLVGTIQQSTTALLTIINDILDLSRIESGRIELDDKPFHLRTCLDGVMAIFVEDARRRGIGLKMTLGSSCPEWVCGDAARLRQVCVNLIGNALKFTLKGSVALDVSAEVPDGDRATLRFCLRDSGIGIDSTVRERLFRPFAQADGSITRRFGGTGLGLSISRSLIDMMDGSISLDSEPGVGTTVRFDIKLAPAAPPPVANRSAASLSAWLSAGPGDGIRRFRGRVLVAEDNPVNQEVTRELLSLLGCTVICVENGAEAVQALATQSFDIVLMDCQMPVMDGLSATRRIRDMERSTGQRRIPIIAVTANAFAEDHENCLSAGMDGYLSKPFNAKQLDETLMQWMPAHLVTERRGVSRAADVDIVPIEPDIDPVVLGPIKRQRPDFYRRLLSTFLAHTPSLVDAIATAADQEAWSPLRLAAHSLKSSSANVGASRLSALARDAEGAVTRGDKTEVRRLAREISEAFGVVSARFKNELGEVETNAALAG